MEPEILPMIVRDFAPDLFLIVEVRSRTWIYVAVMALAGLGGLLWSLRYAPEPEAASSGGDTGTRAVMDGQRKVDPTRGGSRANRTVGDPVANAAGAIRNQRVLTFRNREAMEKFLAGPGAGLRVLGRIGSLNAVRVGFSDLASLANALSDEVEEGLVFPVNIPTLENGQIQDGAVSLGNHLLQWLGVDRASPTWGKGVKVAILDTGVMPNSGLAGQIQLINLVPVANDLSLQNGHGTAVASTIVGQLAGAPGVAPGAQILSVRVADDSGHSDSFLLASGIVEAVDAGAKLINISMGGFGDSPVLRDAVAYAMKNDALVIAATGNNGIDRVHYPAALDGVIGVGAVDAMGEHLDFSNSGDGVDVAAPGYGVRAVWVDGQVVQVSGTSFSAPIVTGVLAATMTNGADSRLTATQAWDLVQGYLNDGGVAGADPQLGGGMPDLGRVLNRDQAGIYDAALASITRLAPDSSHPYGQVGILVQNRGTEPLLNTTLSVGGDGLPQSINLTQLAPGQVQTVKVPISRPLNQTAGGFTVDARVRLGQGQLDDKPANDGRRVVYQATK